VNSFFWRIFLSVWGILGVTVALTVAVATWLPQPHATIQDGLISAQAAELIARDLRRELERDPTQSIAELAKGYELDQAPIQTVYIVTPDGLDVLGRSLPDAVAELASSPGDPQQAARNISRRLHVQDDGLAGYRVIVFQGFFPLFPALAKPGGRVLLASFAVITSAAMAMLLARFIARPVRRLRIAGRKVAAGDLSVRVVPSVGGRSDDIAKLAHDFDLMTERIDALLQSRHRMLRDVSHELRSPLARLQALLSIQRQSADTAETRRIDRMEVELERLDRLIGEILDYSRMEAADGVGRHATDLVDLLQTIIDDAALEAEVADKGIALRAPSSCVVAVESNLVQRAVENVVRNALKHTAKGTAVDVSLKLDAKNVRIIIDDRGPGVPDALLARIFEPFYRVEGAQATRSSGGGIGLAIAERSMRLHGGSASASNREGGGLRVELQLPR
jgi:signal transduction histidine kinase